MNYQQFTQWVVDLGEKNKANSDVQAVVVNLESILNRPFVQYQTINDINKNLLRLINIDAVLKDSGVDYPSSQTAGMLVEEFEKSRVIKEFSKSYPEIEVKRPIALLDVDHTLIKTEEMASGEYEQVLNVTLIEALKKQGFSKVYLFTDMIFRPRDIMHRQNLIKQLKEGYGIDVLGVITPNDLYWTEVNKLDDEKRVELFRHTTNGEVAASHVEFLNSITPNESEDVLGSAFQQVITEHGAALESDSLIGKPSIKMTDCSVVAKALCDIAAKETHEYAHSKGVLLEKFRELHPDAEIIIADDNDEVIASCQQYNEKGVGLPVRVLQVDKHNGFEESVASFETRIRDGVIHRQVYELEEIFDDIQEIEDLQEESSHNPIIAFAINHPVATGAIIGGLVLGLLVVASVFTFGAAAAVAAGAGVAVGLSGAAAVGVGTMFGFFAGTAVGAAAGAGIGAVVDKVKSDDSEYSSVLTTEVLIQPRH